MSVRVGMMDVRVAIDVELEELVAMKWRKSLKMQAE